MIRLPDTDVIIVGGGPAGLTLAIELGRRNVAVALFDDDRADSFSPQANATQARTMEHFRRLGFADEIRRLGLPPDHPTDIVYYTTYAGYELARFRLPTARQAAELLKQLSGSWSAAELPHRVSQMYVERVLQRHAAALPKVTLYYEHEVIAVRDDGGRATATVVHDGKTLEASARYLVGCDGPGSLVRKHLGVRYEGEAGVRRNFAGGRMHAVHLRSDAVTPAMSGPPGWMHVNVHHARRSFMIALDGLAEFVFHTQLLEGEHEAALTGDAVRRMFADCMGREIAFDILFRASWTAGFALVAERFRPGNSGGRLFLAGDAAHLFTPMGGLGYNTAVEDAVNLGWKLAAVLGGWGGGALLESYELERRPAAVRNTGYARAFADSLGNFASDPRLEEASAAGRGLARRSRRLFRGSRPQGIQHPRHHLRHPHRRLADRRARRHNAAARPAERVCPDGLPRRPPAPRLAGRRRVALRPVRLRVHPARPRRRSGPHGAAGGSGPQRRPAADARRPARTRPARSLRSRLRPHPPRPDGGMAGERFYGCGGDCGCPAGGGTEVTKSVRRAMARS